MFMAVPPQEQNCEHQADRHPLLMDRAANLNGHEHVIGISTSNDAVDQSANQNAHEHVIGVSVGNIASSPASTRTNHSDLHGAYSEDNPSTSIPTSVSQLPSMSRAISNSRNASLMRRTDSNSRPNRSPLNSGMWISIELIVNVCQIIAALIGMSLSRHEHPRTPLFEWIIGYTIGCIATIPYLYWRYLRRNIQQDLRHSDHGTSQNNQLDPSAYADITTAQDPQRNGHNPAIELHATITTNTRMNSMLNHFKVALDFFFAVWFIVGNVWVFGARSSFHDAPNMYRLCVVFLVFNCIGYALPFILCVMICCCLPCIVTVVGVREDPYHGRGATSESINALPSYRFKSKRRSRGETEPNLDSPRSVGGLVAAGTDKERIISAEDAICCICLAKYVDNDELRELPCTHFFHKECVDKWLKINALCPLCKTEAGITNDTVTGTGTHHTTQQLADV